MSETEEVSVEVLRSEVAPVVQRAGALVIRSAGDYAAAGEACIAVNRMIRVVGERFDETVDAANLAHKSAVALRASFLDPLKAAKNIITDKQVSWSQEQERIRQEEQRRLQQAADEAARREREKAESAARLQREKEAAARAEQERQERLASQARNEVERQAAAAAAEAARKAADAAAAKAEVREETAAQVVAPVIAVASAVPEVKGQAFRTTWKARVVDAAKVPREWLVVNQQALDAFARSTKGAVAVAGVEMYSEQGLASASR